MPRTYLTALAGILLTAAVLKVGLLLTGAFPFNADEAVVGLMARHILQGRWPTFFYGQAYMGSLDATLVAGAFALIGPRVVAIRSIQLILYLGTVLTTVGLCLRIFGPRPSLMAGLLMAIPSVNMTLYSTISLGGYGEAFLIGNIILLVALAIVDSRDRMGRIRPPGATREAADVGFWMSSGSAAGHPQIHVPLRGPQHSPGHSHRMPLYFAWGLLSGLGLWAFGLTLIYVLPSGLMIGRGWIRKTDRGGMRRGTEIALAGLGAVLGASPWIAYALRHGIGPLLTELGGSAIAGASPVGFLASMGSHTFNLALFGTTVIFGLRPPWEIRWLAPVLIPIVVVFWLGVVVFALRAFRSEGASRPGTILLLGVCLSLLAGFILTPYGADPSGRYFTPLAMPLAVFAAGMIHALGRRFGDAYGWALVAVVLVFNLWGTMDSARRNPPGLTTQFDPNTIVDHSYDQALIDFLDRHGELRGYTNYWVAYPLAFLSSEAQIFVPRLPYHSDLRYTSRDDRYAPYDSQVGSSDRVSYITTGPIALDTELEAYFARMNVEYVEAEIGDYHVYYDLSKRVPPPDFTGIVQE